jgi:1-acyl-sn-glycerol-3-phosphate acyltransferase
MSWQAKSPTPPPGYRYGPRYKASWENVLRGSLYIALGRPRSLARDALFAVANMPVAPLDRGQDLVPEGGPFVVVANHYERPGLWMLWPALFVGHLVRQRTGSDIHWIAIEEWESCSVGGLDVPPWAIRRVFERTYRTYGVIAMAAPDAPTAERASAIRAAVQRVKHGGIIGLMPEGDVGPTPELLPAREGVGSFLLLLAGSGASIVPVGLYEEEDRLVAQFGRPFHLTPPRSLAKEERDRWARDRVMLALRDLLPRPLWGVYASDEL